MKHMLAFLSPPLLLLSGCVTLDPCAMVRTHGGVVVTSPKSGDQVSNGFHVSGCSRTFESTFNWRLLDQRGRVLSRGYAHGGGVNGAAPFSFQVPFRTNTVQQGHLEVLEPDASDGEGPAPSRTVIPLLLIP